MIDSILTRKNTDIKMRITVKSAVSLAVIILAVGLPQLVHMAFGAESGVKLLPMYLPVLLGGCLLGSRLGMAVGLASPIIGFALTSIAGNPMPAAARLPFMAAELVIMAAVAGLFSKKIAEKAWMSFPAAALALIIGRASFVGLVALFGRFFSLNLSVILGQIKAGVPGLLLCAVIVPVSTVIISRLAGASDNK